MTTHIPPDVYHIRVAGTDHYFAEMGNYLALINDGAAAPSKKAQLRVEYADDGIISLFSLNLGVYLCRDEEELDTAGGGSNADFCSLIFGLAEEKRGRKVAKFELFTVEPHSIVALRYISFIRRICYWHNCFFDKNCCRRKFNSCNNLRPTGNLNSNILYNPSHPSLSSTQ